MLRFVFWGITGVLMAGSLLDAITNALSLVRYTIPIAWMLVILWLGTEVWLKVFGIKWAYPPNGLATTIRGIGNQYRAGIIGALILLVGAHVWTDNHLGEKDVGTDSQKAASFPGASSLPPTVAPGPVIVPELVSTSKPTAVPSKSVESQTVAPPQIAVDDFVVYDNELRARMRLKNFGAELAEVSLKVESILGGNPLNIVGDRPSVILFSPGSTKSLEFDRLSEINLESVIDGSKEWDVLIEVGHPADKPVHGYRYKCRFDRLRRQFNVVSEERW